MFAWIVAAGGIKRLAAVYLVLAAVLFLFAFGTWATGAAQHGTAGQQILELHITRYAG